VFELANELLDKPFISNPFLLNRIDMQIDLAAHIEKLLFLHDTLAIPSFGGFTVNRAAAAADYVGGAIHPPSKTLAFNENLITDDGLLVQDVATTHGLGTEEARRIVGEFVEKMQQQLDQREIVTLPGIGRLYKNYVQKIQFLPDSTNFDPEAYGLPPLQFSPIARSRNVAEENAAGSTAGAVPASVPVPAATTPAPATEYTPPPSAGSSRVLAFFAILLLLLAVALGIWWMRRPVAGLREPGAGNIDTTASTGARPDRVGERPADEDTDPEPSPARPAPSERPRAERPASSANQPKSTTTNPSPSEDGRATTTPRTGEGRQCILVIATLREQTNADRLINLLETNGYDVYVLEKNGYQVGIKFNYRELSEIQAKMVELQRLTGEDDIWIKKR
jgi:hypothetical protein